MMMMIRVYSCHLGKVMRKRKFLELSISYIKGFSLDEMVEFAGDMNSHVGRINTGVNSGSGLEACTGLGLVGYCR